MILKSSEGGEPLGKLSCHRRLFCRTTICNIEGECCCTPECPSGKYWLMEPSRAHRRMLQLHHIYRFLENCGSERHELWQESTYEHQLPFSKASALGTSLLSVWCWEEIAANSMFPIFKIPARILYTECTSWKGHWEPCLEAIAN